jgi:putative ubiquitin-RnfH superfamily antitoxin RatB of RatAB toxin-antitoxin module|tara:strand:- start:127290 stop:127568 length:279 start_codon:yes stop_codon:yes gene_type:complete
MLPVEVVYAPEGACTMQTTHAFHTGMTVTDALAASHVFEHYPEAKHFVVGIFSQKVTRDTLIKPGDRVEVYRPLISDPKEKRRKRVKQVKKT